MTYIRFIRHGETDWNKEQRMQGWTDIPLNDTGKMQATKAALRLQDQSWDRLIASPLSRAKHTAEILNEHMQLPLYTMEAFRERRYGDVEGMLRVDRAKKYPSGEYPGAETREELTERVVDGINELHAQYPNKRMIISTHGGTINAILTYLSNGEIGFGKTSIHNLSFTDIEYVDNKWIIRMYNQVE